MSERWSAFWLFCLGAILFIATFWTTAAFDVQFPHEIEAYTILFGLPYVVRELGRRTNWLIVVYLVLLIPIIHYVAWKVGMRIVWPPGSDGAGLMIPGLRGLNERLLPGGLAGGFVGSALSFLIFLVPSLRATEGRPLLVIATGIVGLTLIAGLVIRFVGDEYRLLVLFPVWQIAFGYCLSRLIQPSQRRT